MSATQSSVSEGLIAWATGTSAAKRMRSPLAAAATALRFALELAAARPMCAASMSSVSPVALPVASLVASLAVALAVALAAALPAAASKDVWVLGERVKL